MDVLNLVDSYIDRVDEDKYSHINGGGGGGSIK